MDSVKVAMQALQADIYALQEIGDTVAFKTMVNGLKGYHYHFDPNNHRGLAFVYKSELANPQFYPLFNKDGYDRAFPRRPLVMEVSFKNSRYILINNPLEVLW